MADELTESQKVDVWDLFESGVISEEVARDLLGDSFEAFAEKRRPALGLFFGDANQFFA
ncbi:hypothetical protein [Halogeometricum limi]|uniref:Uncharacterized protein n=1 Tax=Halogeometricum limi TaxID=555875 RepID=A0A1I6IKF3_9EURY|nr:hypothetical protein [Halogeometricum limi]SFR67149.1 hypothetical protein SAMN04488124_3327 [Halogeometricum limi]